MTMLRNHDNRRPSEPSIKYVQLSDEKGLKAIGCPWKPNTLYVLRSKGMYPKLFAKLSSRKVFLVVEELNRMMREGIGS